MMTTEMSYKEMQCLFDQHEPVESEFDDDVQENTEYDEEMAYLDYILDQPIVPARHRYDEVAPEPLKRSFRFPKPFVLPAIDVVVLEAREVAIAAKKIEIAKAREEELARIAEEEARRLEEVKREQEEVARIAAEKAKEEAARKIADDKAAGWDVKQRHERAAPRAVTQSSGEPKTRMCNSVGTGQRCPHGERCRFAHDKAELVVKNCHYGEECRNVAYRNGEYVNKPGKCCAFKHPGEASANYHSRMAKA